MKIPGQLKGKELFLRPRYFPETILFIAVGLICATLFNQFIFGDRVLLFGDIGSDTYYSYYPFYYFISNGFSNLNFSFWSFQLGVGTSTLTLYQFLYDPFSLIYFLSSKEHIPTLIAWVFVFKIYCAAYFTYIYLRNFKIDHYACVIASLLFAFNGFLIIWGQHFFFSSWIIFIPLLFYSIELFLQHRKWAYFSLTIAFFALNIAILYQALIFSTAYFIFRLVIRDEKSSIRKLLTTCLAYLGIVVLGMALSAALWLPEYFLIKSNPRISGDLFGSLKNLLTHFFSLSNIEYYKSLILRLFSNNLEGIGSNYTGFLNYYESLQLYSSTLTLILIPQLFLALRNKERALALLSFVIALFLVLTPGFSLLLNGLQYPAYRWGYGFILFSVIASAFIFNKVLRREFEINRLALIATTTFLISLLFLIVTAKNIDVLFDISAYRVAIRVSVFIVIFSAVLYFHKSLKKITFISTIIFLLCIEIIIENYGSFNKRNTFHKGLENDITVNYFDHSRSAINYIKSEDNSFYRIEKNHWILSLNDSLIQGYRGLDSYNSLNHPSYVDFLRAFNYSKGITTLYWNSLRHPRLADLLSVKYHLTKEAIPESANMAFIGKHGDVYIYQRNTYLPFGITYDSFVSPELFDSLSTEEKEKILIQGVLIDKNLSGHLKPLSGVSEAPFNFKGRLTEDTLDLIEFNNDRITGRICVDRDKFLFLSIPFDKGWQASLNDQSAELLRANVGFSGLYLNEGCHVIELRYRPPYLKEGLIVSATGFLLFLLMLVYSKNPRKRALTIK